MFLTVVIGRTLTGFSPTPNRACDFHRTRTYQLSVAINALGYDVVIGRTLTGFFPTPNRACDFHRTRTYQLSVAINALGQ